MLKPVEPHFHPPAEEIGPIARIVAACAARKFVTLALALVVVAVAAVYAAGHFSISTDLNRLISTDLPWRQREIALDKAFPQRADTILAVLDAENPDVANEAARALEAALTPQKAFFQSAHCLEASDFFRREGLLFLPMPEVEARVEQLIAAQPFLGGLAQDPSLRGLAGVLGLMAQGGGETRDFAGPLESLAGAIDKAVAGEKTDSASSFSWTALFSGAPPTIQDRRRFIQVKPVLDYSALEPGAEAADRSARHRRGTRTDA